MLGLPLEQTALGLRQRAGAFVIDNFFRTIARAGRLHPRAQPAAHGVEVIRDVAYRPTGLREHLLDVYRPVDAKGPLPVVLYVHGGGFRILSKDTHWIMALAFSRAGYLVFNVNYRLAPKHRFPAAIEDVCAAATWVHEELERWGGDPSRVVFAGESAGANLVTSLALATAYRRPEPYAQRVWDTSMRPVAVLPACGIHQVTDPARFKRRRASLSPFVLDRIVEVSRAYVGEGAESSDALALADPLVLLERGEAPERPLAPFFTPVGTKDPLLDDTRRLKAALDKLGVPCEARYYPGELHAFHAAVFRPNAKQCWKDTFAFLAQHVPA